MSAHVVSCCGELLCCLPVLLSSRAPREMKTQCEKSLTVPPIAESCEYQLSFINTSTHTRHHRRLSRMRFKSARVNGLGRAPVKPHARYPSTSAGLQLPDIANSGIFSPLVSAALHATSPFIRFIWMSMNTTSNGACVGMMDSSGLAPRTKLNDGNSLAIPWKWRDDTGNT
jgi:hypothetical protein